MGNGAPVPQVPNFTLDQWLAWGTQNNIDDPKIYDFLSPPLPAGSITRWLTRIERINNASKPNGVTATEWRGRKSHIKGHAFERMLRVVLRSVRFFHSWQNVGTTTNEIDLLVELGIGSDGSPVLKQWGSHFIVECKLVNKSFNSTWVDKLNTVLELHHSEVGLLVGSHGLPKGKLKTAIHILSFKTPPRVIVCINIDDLIACENGQNFLRLITRRYLETKTGAAQLITQGVEE